ncbi:MAG: flagellar filament capping protein FliD [Lachnospiraceae bacterium]|nr:flagellar filament capping protein FliD [Lachnospiraceae bacterium]
MALRMTGLMSGLDTESIVAALMESHKAKKHKVDSKKQKLEWQQEIWSGLNTKIYNFYKDYVGKLRFQTNFKTKKATSSDATKITATAGTGVTKGTYRVNVKSLASAQYVTSSQLPKEVTTTNEKGETVTEKVSTSTKLSDLGMVADGSSQIIVSTGNKTVSLNVDKYTTVGDFVSSLQNAGLNASFDASQGRFYISSKDSGAEQSFTIQSATLSTDQADALNAVKDAVGYDSLSASQKSTVNDLLSTIQNGASDAQVDAAIKTLQDMVDARAKSEITGYYKDQIRAGYTSQYIQTDANGKSLTAAGKQALVDASPFEDYDAEQSRIKNSYEKQYISTGEGGSETVTAAGRKALVAAGVIAEDDPRTNDQLVAEAKSLADTNATKDMVAKAEALIEKNVAADIKEDSYQNLIDNGLVNGFNQGGIQIDSEAVRHQYIADVVGAYQTEISAGVAIETGSSAELQKLGLDTVDGTARAEAPGGTGMVVVAAADSEVQVNGATLKSSSTTIEVNGLTINLLDTTGGSEITITVSDDTQGVYDYIKEFVNQYNSILAEMNKLFNADSARNYNVLTEDQIDEMSEKEVEKWNTKIKDSLLRRDSTLEGLISTLREITGTTITASNGKKYSLAMIGISTGKDYKENGLLHIKGDEDDTDYADSENVLMKLLTEDPDVVTEVLAGLTTNLYNTLTKKMQSTTLSSALTFYNDKEMNKQLSQYNKDISAWEKKLKEIEDRYYNQFTAMEKALSKMNSQQSALSGFFGY